MVFIKLFILKSTTHRVNIIFIVLGFHILIESMPGIKS